MPDRTSTQLSFLAGLVAALVLVPVLALAATTSPAAVQDGATFNATSGPEVTAGEDMNVATHNVFPNSETVRLGNVNVSHAGQIDVNLTGADTSLPTIRPQASPPNDLTLAHDNTSLSASVTGGSIDSLALSDAATVGDSTRDIELDTGGTGTTLTVSGLSGSQVAFIDTSGSQNQVLATKSVSGGEASLSVGANAQRDILLATSPAGFDVSIDSTNSAVVEGEDLTVTATVANTGGAQGTQTVTLDAGALGTNSTSVTLASGASQTVTLSLATSTGDDGTYTATVSSDDDSDSQSVTVLENVPNFQLDITNSNAPISPGGTLTFDIEVENIGAKSDTQGIEVRTGGTLVETTPTTLASGATTTIPVSIDSTQTTVGATATVSSDNDSESFVAREDTWGQVNGLNTGGGGPVAISPSGALVAHGEGSDVVVYDPQTEAALQSITVASGTVRALDWHPDGDRVAIGTGANNLHVYDLGGGGLLDTLNFGGTVEDVEWSPDGDKLLAASRAGTAYVLDANTRAQLRTESLEQSVLSVAWSGDGQRFAIGGALNEQFFPGDGVVEVFEAGGGRIAQFFPDDIESGSGKTDFVRGLAFARDGTRLVAVQQGGDTSTTSPAFLTLAMQVNLYDITAGTRLDKASPGSGLIEGGARTFADATADPTDDRVAVSSRLLPTTVYALGTGALAQVESLGGAASSVDWAASGEYIADSAGATAEKEGDTWRVHASRPVVDGTVSDSNGNPVNNVYIELSQNGQRVDSMVTGGNGAFTLVAPDDGTYNLTAAKTSGNQQIFETKTISVPDDGTTVPFTTTLVDTGISGQVVDAQGNPIPGATVSTNQTVQSAPVNTQGAFVLDTATGGFVVSADAPGFRSDAAAVSVTAGSVTSGVTLQLEAVTGVPISGTVTDPSGNPIDGADLFVGPNATQTNLQGNYIAEVPATGTFVVTAATAVDSKTRTVTVTDPNGTSGVDFVLERADSPDGPAGNLIIRNEQTGEILNNRTVTVTFSTPSETSIRNTTTGIVDMAGLPLSGPVVASGETPAFAARRIKIADTDATRNLFLLDLQAVDTVVLSEFELDDRTGEFSGPDTNATLEVRRPMPLPGETDNIPWRVLLSDYVGAGDTIGMLMQVDERYRLRVRSEDGDVREVGNYVPVRNKTVTLTIGELTWNLGDGTQNVSWDASQVNRSGSEHIRFQYLDRGTQTGDLRLVIHETGNESREIYNETFAGPLSNVTVIEPIPASAANVTSWTVSYNATRGNNSLSAQVVVGPKKFPVDADSDWIPIFSALFLLFLSGFFSTRVANLGAIIVPSVATGLWAMGWLPVPLTWVLAALALGVGAEFAARGGFSDR